MHWSLDQLRDLESDEFDALVEWIKDRNERRSGDGDSVDMDQVIDAKQRAEEAARGSD